MSLFQDQFDALLDHDLAVAPEHRILPTHASIDAVGLFVSVPAPEPPLFFPGLLDPTNLALGWSIPTPPSESQVTETPSPVRDALPLFPPSSPPHAWSLPPSTFAQFPAPASYADAEPFNLYLPQQQQESALGLSLGLSAPPPPAFALQGAFWQPAAPAPPSPSGPSHQPAPPQSPPRKTARSTEPRTRNPNKRVIDEAELVRNLSMPRAQKSADGKRTCTVAGCGVRVTAEQLKRHLETHVPQLRHVCTYPGCGKRYSRKDALKRHRKADGHEED